jgi:hypothetical protein
LASSVRGTNVSVFLLFLHLLLLLVSFCFVVCVAAIGLIAVRMDRRAFLKLAGLLFPSLLHLLLEFVSTCSAP